MIRIAIIRHCEASNGYDDFSRQLSPNGLSQAPLTAEFLRQSAVPWQRLVCSPAKRTRDTARLIAQTLDWPVKAEEKAGLYNPNTLIPLLHEIGEAVDGLVLVGHNPGLSELVSHLTKETLSLPPSGAVIISLDPEGHATLIARHLC